MTTRGGEGVLLESPTVERVTTCRNGVSSGSALSFAVASALSEESFCRFREGTEESTPRGRDASVRDEKRGSRRPVWIRFNVMLDGVRDARTKNGSRRINNGADDSPCQIRMNKNERRSLEAVESVLTSGNAARALSSSGTYISVKWYCRPAGTLTFEGLKGSLKHKLK